MQTAAKIVLYAGVYFVVKLKLSVGSIASYEEFMKASGEDLDCIQMTFPCNGMEYVAVDDNEADEFFVPLWEVL